jgi:hypothetical protein
MTTITDLLHAANAAGEAERERYAFWQPRMNQDLWHVCLKTGGDLLEFGTEADCQRYIAEQGYAARDAYLAEHVGEVKLEDGQPLCCEYFSDGLRLLACAGGNDVAQG